MSRSQWRSVVVVALRLVITPCCLFPAILVKLRNPGAWAHLFATWGYPSWGPLVISTIEIIALAALWIPALATSASAALMITTGRRHWHVVDSWSQEHQQPIRGRSLCSWPRLLGYSRQR